MEILNVIFSNLCGLPCRARLRSRNINVPCWFWVSATQVSYFWYSENSVNFTHECGLKRLICATCVSVSLLSTHAKAVGVYFISIDIEEQSSEREEGFVTKVTNSRPCVILDGMSLRGSAKSPENFAMIGQFWLLFLGEK